MVALNEIQNLFRKSNRKSNRKRALNWTNFNIVLVFSTSKLFYICTPKTQPPQVTFADIFPSFCSTICCCLHHHLCVYCAPSLMCLGTVYCTNQHFSQIDNISTEKSKCIPFFQWKHKTIIHFIYISSLRASLFYSSVPVRTVTFGLQSAPFVIFLYFWSQYCFL
jgi:hypothetical protein